MKRSIFILIFLSVTLFTTKGQSAKSIVKMTTYLCAYSIKGKSEREVKECNILMVWDYNKPSLTIYAKEVQKYNVIKYNGKTYDEKGTATMELIAIDNDGVECLINDDREKDGTLKLYIFRKDFIVCYYYTFEE